ncbi:MAG: hypothetical protein WBB85_14295 [Albidovulum sp.]|uniref:hypothetical protein n=1 Tax=Albidovulum sp. TaxID=1872424 RepID=UPI003C93FA50
MLGHPFFCAALIAVEAAKVAIQCRRYGDIKLVAAALGVVMSTFEQRKFVDIVIDDKSVLVEVLEQFRCLTRQTSGIKRMLTGQEIGLLTTYFDQCTAEAVECQGAIGMFCRTAVVVD